MRYSLSITSQPAQIGVKVHRAPLDIKADGGQIKLKTNPPQLEIRAPRPVVQIDQSVCRANVGIMPVAEFAKTEADKGLQGAKEGTARRAWEGTYLAQIPHNKIEDLFKIKMDKKRESQQGRVPVPPRMNFEYQPLEVKFWPGQVHVDFTPAQFDNYTQTTMVEIYLRQKNFIKIDWIGQNYDRTA